jgi:putative Holliday junction resolvase
MTKVLGLDLGTVTLGVAISRTGIISTGYEEFRYEDSQWQIAVQEVERIVKLENIQVIVLGLPLNMSGTESQMSENARNFKVMIEEVLPEVQVVLIDERWTTKQATNRLLESDMSRSKRKKVIDKMAAQIILDTYLERGF